jgi:hypothetical protein
MGILKNLDQQQKQQFVRLGTLLTGILMLVVFLFIAFNNHSSAPPQTGGDTLAQPAKATIVNGASLYSYLASDDRYKELGLELASLANSYFKLKDKNPTFTIISSNSSYAVGNFGKKNNQISLNVSLENNDRMKIGAKDTTTNKDLSSYFAANSSENQFIGTLPITDAANTYQIGYQSSDGSYVITVYDRDPTLIDQAKAVLQQKLGIRDLSTRNVHYLFPPANNPDVPDNFPGD